MPSTYYSIKIPLDGDNLGKFLSLIVIDTVELATMSTSAVLVEQNLHHKDFNKKMKNFYEVKEKQLEWIEQTL